jgi:hypothetical protein
MVLVGRKPKSEYVIPEGLACNTMGLVVIPSNTQKPKYAQTATTTTAGSGNGFADAESISNYSTWKLPTGHEFQRGSDNDLQTEPPKMDEYPVTVPFTHATPFADGLRTYRPVPDSRYPSALHHITRTRCHCSISGRNYRF